MAQGRSRSLAIMRLQRADASPVRRLKTEVRLSLEAHAKRHFSNRRTCIRHYRLCFLNAPTEKKLVRTISRRSSKLRREVHSR